MTTGIHIIDQMRTMPCKTKYINFLLIKFINFDTTFLQYTMYLLDYKYKQLL